jgi:hypothetical protein
MNVKKYLDLIKPKTDLGDLAEQYLTWAGVSFICFFIADGFDHLAEASYAAYYTGAINEAVSTKFWVLLGVTGLLLFCMALPAVFLARRLPALVQVSHYLRRITQAFCLIAFKIGALIVGIWTAHWLHFSDKDHMLASKSLLIDDIGFFSILALGILNTLYWLIGEGIYNRDDRGYSGLVGLILDWPVKYSLPAYTVFTGTVMYLIASQQ